MRSGLMKGHGRSSELNSKQATPQRTLPGGTERHSSLTPAQAPAHRVTFARLLFEAGGVAPWQMA